jgi:hypothetical protein
MLSYNENNIIYFYLLYFRLNQNLLNLFYYYSNYPSTHLSLKIYNVNNYII